MNKEQVIKALQELRKASKKRNFKQSVDIVLTFKDLNLKNPNENLDFYMSLPVKVLKKKTICAFAGSELQDQAEKFCDKVITQPDFDKYDKKAIKKLANEYTYFIAQANIMVKVAAKFGRILGTRGKMPNPKAGCVVPPKGNVQTTVEKLQNLIRIRTNKSPIAYATIGTDDASDEELAKNAVTIIDQVVHHLPKEIHNLRNIYLKFTMSKPVKIEK